MTGDATLSVGAVSLGLSPCPNDTFMFYALLHEKVPLPCVIKPVMADVEELNRRVIAGRLDVSKVSFAVVGRVLEEYVLLPSGSALGRGCGPLIVARRPMGPGELSRCLLAIPGEHTTAALLLRLFMPGAQEPISMHFAGILEAVKTGAVDAGVIIHETRFTYESHGLVLIQDLGAWWEQRTGLPVPLGGIVARRSLGGTVLRSLNEALRYSVRFARENPAAAAAFVREHAREMSEEVLWRHIGLYVNQYSLDLGRAGLDAVRSLLEAGREQGVFQGASQAPIELTLPPG